MLEMNVTRLYEMSVLLYALSVSLYFIDFLHHNRKANRTAFWLLSIVWVFQTAFFLLRIVETKRFPILTMSEGLYFYAWVLITLSLVINRLLRVDFIVFFTNVLAFFMLALHTFAPAHYQSEATAEKLISELLIIHITMAILAYVAFSLSFVFSVLYMIQYHLLKQKKWGKRLLRMTDLTKLEEMSHILNLIGLPMLLLGLILGLIWAYIKIEHFHWYDAKVLGSFLVLAVYSFYFYKRIVQGIRGKTIALWNIGSFFFLLINFFLFGSLSKFHLWYS
ncbi:cytochrome C assembly family protein [Anoxybacillus sp. B7M1]|jgi:HemX protein|uniref:Cytochrome c biogenesis protein n=1 Tax=Anoxybacteroides rupiense TaxID=311460 RepID=A0ABT5W0I2_9BACL|nr:MULTISPECIES: cytochrome c biogenesis protein [Anoxybacillus]ANB58150.1 cytochrome C assembly family protein [Anoxybacillus sp. B2M1]ANB62597.1 cytochrome C assembly family protein [Anoxybacillus sp. B7M1]KXG11502.1 Cytochrome c biogenesis protein CcsA [Anoxybacillus sp. P3H1B]MBB3907169.1 HemX protein [Anoxybacillus rupiensis]MBS2771613.1 cytochrome c biogenesis protein CcsA [Anoxybacillus rupiensis]